MKRATIIFSLIMLLPVLPGGQLANAQSRPAPAAASGRPFNLARYPAPEEPSNTHFEPVHCAEIAGGLRVCKHITEAETFFALEKHGAVLGKWPAVTYNGGTSRFEALKGDLDGDGEDEIIVANCTGVTNGIGFQYWNISIMPDPEKHEFKPPLEFSVEEYGAEGTFVKHPGDNRCNILATEWQWDVIKEPKRPSGGLYFVGRWFRYQKGSLVSITTRSTLVRRYLTSFEKERSRTVDSSKKPLSWFQNRSTKSLPTDPFKLLKEVSTLNGQILNLTQGSAESDENSSVKIKIRLDSGQIITYSYSDDDAQDAADKFYRLGNAQSGSLYPEVYAPMDVKLWLVGKKVRVAAYKDNGDALRRILWVD